MAGRPTSVAFESKFPHTTPWLSIEFDVDEEPSELLSDLRKIDWLEDGRMNRLPPLDGRQEITVLGPTGTGLFNLWTDAERRQHLPVVRRVLRRHGFNNVPWNRLTLADLL